MVRWISLFTSVLFFSFAAISGATNGVLNNLPNAIPWVFPLIAAILSFWYGKISGYIFIAYGLFTIFFFSTYDTFLGFIVITMPWIVFGVFNILVKKK